MTDSTVINQIFASLLQLCSGDDYNFEKFKGSWGYRTSEAYQEKKLDFIEKIRKMAKEAAIKYYDGSFYLFDGKIYVTIREELIVTAYDLLLEHLRIVPMIGEKTVCKKYFIDIIRYYNQLIPRPDLIAFTTGVPDLRESRLFPFSPAYHVTTYPPS